MYCKAMDFEFKAILVLRTSPRPMKTTKVKKKYNLSAPRSTWTMCSRCGRYSLAEQRRVRAATLGRLQQRRQHLLLRLALGAARPPTDTQQAMPHASHSTLLHYHYARSGFKNRYLLLAWETHAITSYAKIKISTANSSKIQGGADESSDF